MGDELAQLQRQLQEKNDERRKRQRALLDQRRQRRDQSNTDNTTNGSSVTKALIEMNSVTEQIELDFNTAIDASNEQLGATLAELNAEHEEKVKDANKDEELVSQLMSDLAKQQQALQHQNQQRKQAAFAARQAKLEAARGRKQQLQKTSSTTGEIGDERVAIERAIDSGL